MIRDFNRAIAERVAFNIRKHTCNAIIRNGEGHAGPSLSCADILAVLYTSILDFDPQEPTSPTRDKFILSAGHKALALYGALIEAGVIDKSVLDTYNQLGTLVPGHPDMTKLPGVSFSSGSLGHGLPVGCGFAMADKLKKNFCKTYVLMGDGEHGEGAIWEAAGFAVQHRLDNLVAIVDENGLQINGTTRQILYPASFESRYSGFGWSVRTIDGNNVDEIYAALSAAPFEEGKPSLVVAKTIKGKGISFMENNVNYHHWDPNPEEAARAERELAEKEAAMRKKEEAICR